MVVRRILHNVLLTKFHYLLIKPPGKPTREYDVILIDDKLYQPIPKLQIRELLIQYKRKGMDNNNF